MLDLIVAVVTNSLLAKPRPDILAKYRASSMLLKRHLLVLAICFAACMTAVNALPDLLVAVGDALRSPTRRQTVVGVFPGPVPAPP